MPHSGLAYCLQFSVAETERDGGHCEVGLRDSLDGVLLKENRTDPNRKHWPCWS